MRRSLHIANVTIRRAAEVAIHAALLAAAAVEAVVEAEVIAAVAEAEVEAGAAVAASVHAVQVLLKGNATALAVPGQRISRLAQQSASVLSLLSMKHPWLRSGIATSVQKRPSSDRVSVQENRHRLCLCPD